VTCGLDAAVGPSIVTPGTTGGGVIAPGATAGTGGTAAGGTTGALPPNPIGGLTAGGSFAGAITAGGSVAGGIVAGGTTAGPDAGPPSTGGGGGTTGGTMLPPVTGGTTPKIPEIKGACPEFKNGTVMVAGHKAILLTVGAAGKMGPVYFFWHGTGGSASNVSQVPASIRNEVISSGGIIASFNGNDSSGTGGDCSGTGAHNIADFDAADQIVACAVKNHGVDPRRIYTTGCSAGGLQSGCMAQMRSSYIAASAPNSGGLVVDMKWQDAGKPAIFTMHGGDSDWVIVSFSDTSATMDMLAKAHGSFVVNCNHGGGHCGAPAALYEASWKFMKDHPYGVESPWKGGIPAGVAPDYCKIY
jgi:predicted esterase